MAAAYQALGTAVATATNAATLSPAWPTHQVNDIALLIVESGKNTTSGVANDSLTTASGFVQVDSAAVGTTLGLQVYWCRATSAAMAAPVLTLNFTNSDHLHAQIITFRGCIATGNPWDVKTTGNKTTASSTFSVTSITTTIDNAPLVAIVARDNDSASAAFSGWGNATSGNPIERADSGTALGNGGGIGVAVGTKTIAGATGNTTGIVTSSANAFVHLALIPGTGGVEAVTLADATVAATGLNNLVQGAEAVTLADATVVATGTDPAAPYVVQSVKANYLASGSTSNTTTTVGITTTSGNALVAFMVGQNDGTVTDSYGNTWTAVDNVVIGDANATIFTFYTRIYYCLNCTGGTGHTFSANTTAGYASIFVAEMANVATTGGFVGFSHTLYTTTDATPYLSGTITTTRNNTLLIGACGNCQTANVTYSYGNSFSLVQEEGDNQVWTGALSQRQAVSAGSYESSTTSNQYPTNSEAVAWVVAFQPSASTGISGTESVTLAAATVAATGTVKVQGSESATLSGATVAATGTVKVQGAESATLADSTNAATGSVPAKGAESTTLAGATVAATGSAPAKGAENVTLDGVTPASSGTAKVQGAQSASLADATVSGTGTVKVVGNASQTLDAATVSAQGAAPAHGTQTAQLADATVTATGGLGLVSGAEAVTLDDAAVTAAGAVKVAGSESVGLDDATVVATSGTAPALGVEASTLDDAVVAAAGVAPIHGAASPALDDAQVSAAGTAGVHGAESVTLAGVTPAATGAAKAQGAETVTLADAGVVAEGLVGAIITTGEAAQTLAGAAVVATGVAKVHGTEAKTLDPAVVAATGTGKVQGVAADTLGDATIVAAGKVKAVGASSTTLDDATVHATASQHAVTVRPPLVVERPDSWADGAVERPRSSPFVSSRQPASVLVSARVAGVSTVAARQDSTPAVAERPDGTSVIASRP